MSENNIRVEIAKLKIFILLLFLIIIGLGILLFKHSTKDTPVLFNNSTSDYTELKVLKKNINQLERKLEDLYNDIETMKNILETSLINYEDRFNLLREPNILSPFHTYSGQAGILYKNLDGEGRWIPNSYGYELSRLIDQAVRNGKGLNISYPDKFILVNYHLDEVGPSIDIVFDLEENNIIVEGQRYLVSEDYMEIIINFLESTSIDGNAR